MNAPASDDYNILLIDDDVTVIAALGTVLQELGRVRFARSGTEGLRLAQPRCPASPLKRVSISVGDPALRKPSAHATGTARPS
jgi:hypothetical protein